MYTLTIAFVVCFRYNVLINKKGETDMTYTEKGDLMIKFLGFEHTAVIEYWTALERKQLDLCDIIFMNFEQTLYRGAKK